MNRASDASSDPTHEANAARRRLRFELIFASLWLAVGLFLLPALIFAVGILLLGPYGEGAGLGRFYADFFSDLAAPSGRAWLIAFGPLLLVSAIRAVFLGMAAPSAPDDGPPEPARPPRHRPRPAAETTRVEPRIGLD